MNYGDKTDTELRNMAAKKRARIETKLADLGLIYYDATADVAEVNGIETVLRNRVAFANDRARRGQ